jgi:hypothetical protein
MKNAAPLPPFELPSQADYRLAERICNSHPVISAYGSVEWDCLHADGQEWLAAIVREVQRDGAIWHPVETAPRDGSWFFTKSDSEAYCSYDVAQFVLELGDFCKAGCGFQYVTHWRPAEGALAAERQRARLTADTIVQVNAFLTHMAERFRERASRRFLGIRINTMPPTEAMVHALATFEASLDMDGISFGDPAYGWDRDHARELVDEELHHWEA